MKEPLLSIVTITYNHEPFIAKTIEGVLMQQVNFPIEFIIAEDCSTDKTREIVLSYAEKYPDLIKIIISDKNIGSTANERRAMQAAKGKYIAFCEGDDYWIDPLKLQKQVDFLESHLDYSVTFHRCVHFDVETGIEKEDACGNLFEKKNIKGIEVTTEMFFSKWITQPLTMVYRNEAFDLDTALQYKYYRDMHLIYHLLQAGKGYLFGFVGGVYQNHNDSAHAKRSLHYQVAIALLVTKELYKQNKNELTKRNYLRTLDWAISCYKQNKWSETEKMNYIFECLFLSYNVKKTIKHILK